MDGVSPIPLLLPSSPRGSTALRVRNLFTKQCIPSIHPTRPANQPNPLDFFSSPSFLLPIHKPLQDQNQHDTQIPLLFIYLTKKFPTAPPSSAASCTPSTWAHRPRRPWPWPSARARRAPTPARCSRAGTWPCGSAAPRCSRRRCQSALGCRLARSRRGWL